MKNVNDFYPVAPLQVQQKYVQVLFGRLPINQKAQFKRRFFKNGKDMGVDVIPQAFNFCADKLELLQ